MTKNSSWHVDFTPVPDEIYFSKKSAILCRNAVTTFLPVHLGKVLEGMTKDFILSSPLSCRIVPASKDNELTMSSIEVFLVDTAK